MVCLSCPVCREAFNLRKVWPKVLPCGHSVCRSCLGNIKPYYCPICRAAFKMPVPDNFALVEQLEAEQPEGLRDLWWCKACNSLAAKQCMDEHGVRRPKHEELVKYYTDLWENPAVPLQDIVFPPGFVVGVELSWRAV